MDETIQLDPELEARFAEWSRWARQRGWLSACRSIEGRYRPPAGEVWDEEPRPMPVAILQAWEVECAWRASLHIKERRLVKAVWITAPRGSAQAWEAHKRRVCRELMIRRAEFAPMAVKAASTIGRTLQRAQFRPRMQPLSAPHAQMRVETASSGGFGVAGRIVRVVSLLARG